MMSFAVAQGLREPGRAIPCHFTGARTDAAIAGAGDDDHNWYRSSATRASTQQALLLRTRLRPEFRLASDRKRGHGDCDHA